MQHQGDAMRENQIDRRLEDGKAFLSILEGFTEGIILCEPLRGTIKVGKEILVMLQVTRQYLPVKNKRV
jgi:hypothetical protein